MPTRSKCQSTTLGDLSFPTCGGTEESEIPRLNGKIVKFREGNPRLRRNHLDNAKLPG